MDVPESGCSDCGQVEHRVTVLEHRVDNIDDHLIDLQECCEEVHEELDTKLTKDNILAGRNVEVDISGDDVIIHSDATVDLSNYYNKVEIDEMLSDIEGLEFVLVDTLTATGESGKIYLLKIAGSTNREEYIWVNNQWELIGDTAVDLSNYYNKTEVNNLLNTKVDKVTGKGLSTNDYTNAEKTKLAGIEAGAEVNVQSDWNQTDSTKDDFIKNKPGKATQSADGLMSKEDKKKLDGINWTKEGILELLDLEEVLLSITGKEGAEEKKMILARDVLAPPTYRTALYPDGHLIINESSRNQAANETAHGGQAVGVYAAFDPLTNPYAFTADGDQPWFLQIDDILSVAFGSAVAPTSTFRWFSAMHNVVTIDLTGLDTSGTTTFERMFTQCNRLKNVNTEVLDTSSVTSMMMTFFRCDAVETLDLSTWDTSRVTNTNQMFRTSGLLETIYASAAFVTTAVTNNNNMFTDCTSLIGGAGTTYDSTKVKTEYARIDNPPTAPGYFTAKP